MGNEKWVAAVNGDFLIWVWGSNRGVEGLVKVVAARKAPGCVMVSNNGVEMDGDG